MADPGPIQDHAWRVNLAQHMNIVRSHSHCIWTGDSIGTGVSFRVENRLFLITAGHCLQGNVEVHLFKGEGASIKAEVLSRYAHPDSMRTDIYKDIGFVEIRDVPHIGAADLEQLHIGLPEPAIPENALMFIAGCPKTGYVRTGPKKADIGIAVISGYLKSGDHDTLEIEYERTGFGIAPDGKSFEESDFFKTPEGFSGGGVWSLMAVKDDELFNPAKHVKMSATQFQWNSGTRLLKAMRPRFSIPFFFEKYPDLKKDYGYVLDRL